MSTLLKQNMCITRADDVENLLHFIEELQEEFQKRNMYLKHFSCYYDPDNKKHIQVSLFEGKI